MPRIYGSCGYGAGKYGDNDAPVLSSGSLSLSDELVIFNYGLSDTDKDLCALLAAADLQYSKQVGGSPSTWHNTSVHASSTTTNLTSGCSAVSHSNELFWHWTEDVIEAASYYLRLRVDDGQPSTYSDYLIVGPLALDPENIGGSGNRKNYWNYRKRTLAV